MRFLTPDECRAWAGQAGFRVDDRGTPARPSQDRFHVHHGIPRDYTRLTWFCGFLERSLCPRQACLLWVVDWNIWEENLHLYYRLRQSYGDPHLLHEAPGHLFLNYEAPELVSFLQVGILCGWDVHLLPAVGYARAFVSHDEFVEFASDENNPKIVEEFTAELSKGTQVSRG